MTRLVDSLDTWRLPSQLCWLPGALMITMLHRGRIGSTFILVHKISRKIWSAWDKPYGFKTVATRSILSILSPLHTSSLIFSERRQSSLSPRIHRVSHPQTNFATPD